MTRNFKKILKIALISIFLIFIIVYAFFISKELIFGIKITKVNIEDNLKVTNNIQKITGNAKNAIKLTLNDREISIDQQGNFEETISLLPGYNIISIKAQDKFGNEDKKNYKLIY